MEIRHLRYFVAIAEERSFTRAAERLWIAQPGLSTQIRRLEAELGIQLFDRHSRGVDLTDAGEVFLQRARIALAAAEDVRSTGRQLESGMVGTIRLGIAGGARWRGTDSLLDGFACAHPDVEITVVESHGGTLLRDVRDRRLDALLAPAFSGSAELRRVRLGWEPWAVLVGPGHRLARPGPVAADELHGEQIVATGHRDGAGYDRAVAEMLGDLRVTFVPRRGGPGPSLLAAVTEGKALMLTTPAGAATRELIVRPLQPIRLVGFELSCRDETPSPAVAELIRAAQASAQPMGPGERRPALVAA
jgi:DNA-binding transcriptional LysR family regulator